MSTSSRRHGKSARWFLEVVLFFNVRIFVCVKIARCRKDRVQLGILFESATSDSTTT